MAHHSHEDHLSELQEVEQERDHYKKECEELEKEIKRLNNVYYRFLSKDGKTFPDET